MYLTVNSVVKTCLGLSLVLSVGCASMYGERGVFRGKGKDYLKTGALKPIEVPAGMESRKLETLYVIPEADPRDEFGDQITLGEYEVPRPEPINTEKGEVGVKIQKLGERMWIFLNASTSQVWPRAQNYLSQYGFSVAYSDPVNGIIETGDVAFKDDNTKVSRFRFSVEKGVHPETTEIHILQAEFGSDEAIPSKIDWHSVSKSSERATALLNQLASVLVKNINNNSASLLGQNVGGLPKVEFLKGQAEPTMRIRLFDERAKASLSHALEKDSFVLWEEAVSHGLYYVGYAPKEEGFFGRLMGDELPDKAPHGMKALLASLSENKEVRSVFGQVPGVGYGDPLPDAMGLFVVISKQGNAMDVLVRDFRGERIAAPLSKQILREIRKNLI